MSRVKSVSVFLKRGDVTTHRTAQGSRKIAFALVTLKLLFTTIYIHKPCPNVLSSLMTPTYCRWNNEHIDDIAVSHSARYWCFKSNKKA